MFIEAKSKITLKYCFIFIINLHFPTCRCCSVVEYCLTLWDLMTAARQAPLCFTVSQSLLNFFPLSRWCYLTISSFAALFSFSFQSLPQGKCKYIYINGKYIFLNPKGKIFKEGTGHLVLFLKHNWVHIANASKVYVVLLLRRFSRVQLCATPETAAHQAPPSLGFSRQEHWSGWPFPSPMHESEKWKWSRSVMPDSSRPHGLQPTRPLRPGDSPGESTGVGCHCLLHMWCYTCQTEIQH